MSTQFRMTIFEPEKSIENSSLLRVVKYVHGNKEETVLEVLTVKGKSSLLQKDISEDQFKELTGDIKWGRPKDFWLTEYTATVLAATLLNTQQ